MEQALRGVLAYKGERGYSAYEVAVQNGFIGTEQDWLATLGTSSHFSEDKVIHISTASQTVFDIPDVYTSNSFIDVYVNGLRLNTSEYTIDSTTKKITLTKALSAGAEVEIVVLTMATNNLPIVETINESSTNETATGTKAVYDYVQNIKNTLDDTIEQLRNNVEAEKMDKSNIQVLTGSISNIAAGETAITDINYPVGFTKSNTLIISSMCSSANNYYDTVNTESTTNGFPIISMIALTDSTIRVWLKNTNNTSVRNGYYKIGLMKQN